MLNYIFSVVLPAVFGIFAATDLWAGYRAFVAASHSGQWPWVDGTVRSAEIGERSMIGEPGVRPVIAYEYSVGGMHFIGSQIAFGLQDNFFSGGSFARKYIDRYPAGRSVRVYYDPLSPSSSVLEPGFSLWTFAPTLWGIGMLALIYALCIANPVEF